MKTNFKKLAILAGATATMAAGSMSAHAVITSIAAPAQLVPFFYWNSGKGIDTAVRIQTPKSVGADTVISLLGGSIAASTSWSTAASTLPNSVHYTVMTNRSTEVCDGAISVTGDSEVYLEASEDFGRCATSGVPYYLLLTNESARFGGAPTFQFEADAWLENDQTGGANGLSSSVAIPVLAMTDTADTTTYPTPSNNVIENYPTSAGGPIASPIHTGIRTSSTTTGLLYRVVDVPVFDSRTHYNTLIAWASSNSVSGSANGLTGKIYSVSATEVTGSLGTFSFPNQLNVVKLGCDASLVGSATNACLSTGVLAGSTTLGVIDSYTNGSISTLQSAAGNNGFLKLVIEDGALPAPAATLSPGAYSSVVLFNIPSYIATVAGTDESELALDTGFFTSN